MIYLDNAATTKIDNRVLQAMQPYLTEYYGNAGTLYSFGKLSRNAITKARAQVAELIGATPEQIVFTSGGTEANNMVFAGIREHLHKNCKNHIITSQIEHDSVLKSVRSFCDPIYPHDRNLIKDRFYASFMPPDKGGFISPKAIIEYMREETGLVSIMHTNNETGVENPVRDIADVCKYWGILFHTDCVQAAGHSNLDVNKIGCDFMSLSSHKIHAPKGVGALYIRDKSLMSPLIFGGAAQEFGLRGGTENVAGIVGFGAACEIMKQQLHNDMTRVSVMRVRIYEELKAGLESCGLTGIMHINGSPLISGKILNVRFDNVDAETLLLMLDGEGVCVSAGSACRSHESEPSHVLMAMGIDAEDARNSIRISLSRMNTEQEVVRAAEIIVNCVRILYQL